MSIVTDIIERGDTLLNGRSSLLMLWQEIANNFFVQRADFTQERTAGDEFASHLYSGYPLIVHRELSNSFSSMLRPTALEWFHVSTDNSQQLTSNAREFLQWATDRQRRAMYDRKAQFIRATKEGDQDFAAFGQCVISYDIDWTRPGLIFQTWHLRDCAWAEKYDGSVCEVHRNWEPTLQQLVSQFGEKNLSQELRDKVSKRKGMNQKVKMRVATMMSDGFEPKARQPYIRFIIECDTKNIVERSLRWNLGYIVPRWQTVSGSQYAYSPATVTGLPDARLLQAMTLTLLEAGEMAVRPPVVTIQDAIQEFNWYSGGISVADAEYDQRLGDVVQPISQDLRGLPFGMEMNQDIRNILATSFYLNKITLPQHASKEMTAYETSERIQEYIREAAPLFEPMEYEYNAVLCEEVFDMLMRAGVFGPYRDIPRELQGQDVRFIFESPLHEAIERKKGQKFFEAREMLMAAAELDPAAMATIDIRDALRDALHSVGTPARWLNSEDVVEENARRMMEQREQEKALAMAQQAGEAGQAVAQADAAA